MKRSPLTRKTPLARKTPLRASQPPVVKLRPRRWSLRPGIPREIRQAVFDRSNGRCDHCGQPVRDDRWECHHRRRRAHGGPHTLANLICLHPVCHQQVHAHPAGSFRDGFLVPSSQDPEAWPVHRFRGWPSRARWQQPTDAGWTAAQPTDLQVDQYGAAA